MNGKRDQPVFTWSYLYKPVPMSELGYWLRHLASGLRPSRISAVYEMYVKYLSILFNMYVRGISDVDEM